MPSVTRSREAGVSTTTPLGVGEETFALHCQAYRIPVEREYRFCARRWRLDFALVDKRIGIEVEGGTWTNGRHSRGSGYERDLDKYNALAKMGWIVFRYTTAMVTNGTAINEILEVLGRL